MRILGIETSCDETSVAIVDDGKTILSNIVLSQIDLHQKYGGVVPEIASRAHLQTFLPVLEESLAKANCTMKDIAAIAVTNGPGLVGALLMGVTAAKSIALLQNIPIMAVNHLHGHIYAAFLENPEIEFPLVCLIVSGGHTTLVYMPEHVKFVHLGSTFDDAAGEAFDKVGKRLGLDYPSGPHVDRLAKNGNPNAIQFPRSYLEKGSYDFSFSGLKTAVVRYLEKHPVDSNGNSLENITASFQQAVVDVLIEKTFNAAIEKDAKSVIVCGGVAANSALRHQLTSKFKTQNAKLYIPRPGLCTDNAAMIAAAAYYQIQAGYPYAGWDLDAVATVPIEL
jgi:N6-L-threonylcarbamoyladenine synthase